MLRTMGGMFICKKYRFENDDRIRETNGFKSSFNKTGLNEKDGAAKVM